MQAAIQSICVWLCVSGRQCCYFKASSLRMFDLIIILFFFIINLRFSFCCIETLQHYST